MNRPLKPINLPMTRPLGFEDGLNLYAYVHNHPFYYKDPDGQFAFIVLFVIAPTFGALVGAAIGASLG